MKLFAQYGSGPGTKVAEGLERGSIDGVIIGAKDESASFQKGFMREVADKFPDSTLLFDPQFYACFIATKDRARLGSLWSDDSHRYENDEGYFRPLRRRDLEKESDVVRELERCLAYQTCFPVSGLIAPNIVIRRSLDSMEAAIAKNFIRLAAERRDSVAPGRKMLATLAISASALADRRELYDFLDDITLLDNPPDGFYLLLETSDSTPPYSLSEPDMLARWMLINRAFKVNGFEVVNGYSDLLAPYLGVAGADAGASGWHGTLKSFSLNRFEPLDGRKGRAFPRYTSSRLLKSIKWTELLTVGDFVPEVWNGTPCDAFFKNGTDDSESPEPSIHQQALQNWEALRLLISRMIADGDVTHSLERCSKCLDEAEETFVTINEKGLTLRDRSNSQHVQTIREELDSFTKLAEISR